MLSRVFIDRPIFAWVLAIIVMLAGVGAIMGLADHVGGTAATINLGPGQATTTLESKTNFLRPIRIGDTAHARCVALHRGRTTMIWQTTITRDDGKVAAIVTQTQMILEWRDGG